MITQETAGKIWECYREIEAGSQLLADMREVAKENAKRGDSCPPTLSDVFGRKRGLELGVPAGRDSHRIFNVAPDLAESVIRAHIAKQEAALAEANEQARIELNEPHQR